MSQIGPTLPPHMRNHHSSSSSEDDDDTYGPALPPHLKNKIPEVIASSSSTNYMPVKSDPKQPKESSSDEEIIGPLPVGMSEDSYNSAVELEKRSLKMRNKLLGLDKEDVNLEPKREDWMIELPEVHTKNFGLGPRSFNRSDKPEITGRDQWTTTPNSKPTTSSKEKKDSEQDLRNRYLERKRNEELEKIVDRHDKKKRSKSLLEIHQKELKRKREEDSKPKERKPFDRDEDLKLNKIDDAKRKALIKRSHELNSKFKIGNQKFL